MTWLTSLLINSPAASIPLLLIPAWPMNPLQLRDIKLCMSRPIGTAAELERRRRHAVDLLNQGESPTVVARILGVGRPSLYRWLQLASSGPDGLTAKPHPGPTALRDT